MAPRIVEAAGGVRSQPFGYLILKKLEQPSVDSIHKNSKKRPYIILEKNANNTSDKTSERNSISSIGRIFQWGHSTAGWLESRPQGR